MKIATTNTAYLVGLSARILKCTVTHDPHGQTTDLDKRDPKDLWQRELMIRVRGAINTLGLPGGFTVAFDHEPPTNARPDLAIVAACLLATGLELGDISRTLFLGELSYSGVAPMRGVLPILETVEGFSRAFVPRGNAIEAGVNTNRITCMTIENVHDLIDPSNVEFAPSTMFTWEPTYTQIDQRFLIGVAKTLGEIAQSDKNVLIVGANAWAAAKVFHNLLPRLSAFEARAIACVHSAVGLLTDGRIPTVRPFRAPHYTVVERGLVGDFERPGEISLAHYGVLVLDHVTQFKRAGLELLKNSVRTNVVTCCRKDERVEWPAKCRIVAKVYPDELRFLTPERLDFLGDYVRVDL